VGDQPPVAELMFMHPIVPRFPVAMCSNRTDRNRPFSRPIAQVKLGGSAAVSRVMVIISFTDGAGNHWARGARGELRQLPTAAIDYWKVHQEDVDWQVPSRLD
jgi:hypothetical protein